MSRADQLGKRFGRRIRIIRKLCGVSTAVMSERCNLATFVILAKERGAAGIRLGEAAVMCEALGVSLERVMVAYVRDDAWSDLQAAKEAYDRRADRP